MDIDVRDTSLFFSKKKRPEGFDQLGSVYVGEQKGLLLYHKATKEFKGLFSGKVYDLDTAKVLIRLGLAYLKYNPRSISAKGGRNGNHKKKRHSPEFYQKLVQLSLAKRRALGIIK